MGTNPYQAMQLLNYDGTSNVSGTLNAAGSDTDALSEGVWAIWADQGYQFQINSASGSGFGANPSQWPASFINYYVVPSGRTHYLAIKRIDTDGNYYANKITQGVA
jgi:hypothetical protein